MRTVTSNDKNISASPSSSGPGHRPFTAVTGVRTPLGTPNIQNTRRPAVASLRVSAVACEGIAIKQSNLNAIRGSLPPKDAVLSDLCALIERDTHLYFIYSEGGMEPYYNYQSQFADIFPSLRSNSKIRVKQFPEADHTFTLLSHQKILIDDIVDWISTTCTRST
jgi:hypothetical protein